MKKLTTYILIIFSSHLAFSQSQKPGVGARLFDLKLNPGFVPDAGLNEQYGGFLFRKYKTNEKVIRNACDVKFTLGKNTELTEAFYNYGVEFHQDGSQKLSPYWGYSGGLGLKGKSFGLNGGLFTGFDYHFVPGLYLGVEIGYRVSLDLDPFEFSSTGAEMNAALKFGYIFSNGKAIHERVASNNNNSSAETVLKPQSVENGQTTSDMTSQHESVATTEKSSNNSFTIEINNKKIEVLNSDLTGEYQWKDAKTQCTQLGEGWRLPSLEEMNSIVDYQNNNLIDLETYWCDSSVDDSTAWGYKLKNGKGSSKYVYKGKSVKVRPVRSLF